jgi:glutamine synthetase adenylyltransferase
MSIKELQSKSTALRKLALTKFGTDYEKEMQIAKDFEQQARIRIAALKRVGYA